MKRRAVVAWVIALVLVAGLVGILARGRWRSGSTTTRSGEQGAVPAQPAERPQDDLAKRLTSLLFADQSLRDDLLSMAQFAPELQPVLAAVDAGRCEDAIQQANAMAAGSPSSADPKLLLAHVRAGCGDRAGAAEALKGFLADVEGQSLATLQAWHRLRQLGVEPPAEHAREVLGLIVEIGFPAGSDIIAAYADGSSRFFSHGGGGIAGTDRRPEVAEAARRVVAASRAFAASAENQQARDAVPAATVRFTFLTPSGPRVATSTKEALQDGTSELLPLFAAAAELQVLKRRGYED
jgi:hypothetical protein